MSLSSTFAAVGVSASQDVNVGDRVTWLLSGSWVGTVLLEFSDDGGKSWREVRKTTANVDGAGFEVPRRGLLRFRCSARASGTITYSLTIATPVLKEFISPSGKKPLSITEGGIDVDGALSTTGAASIGGTLILPTDVVVLVGSGVPTNGTTGAAVAGPGSMYVDYTNANLYINGNTKASPTWKLVTRAA